MTIEEFEDAASETEGAMPDGVGVTVDDFDGDALMFYVDPDAQAGSTEGELEELDPLLELDALDDEYELESAPEVASFDVFEPDDSSLERWVQSCLQYLIAPRLDVDGALGYRSRVALKKFQRRARKLHKDNPRLSVDGRIGPNTIAALERTTDTSAPTNREAERAARTETPSQQPTSSSEPVVSVAAEGAALSVRTEDSKRGVVYVVSDGAQEVRFRYWAKDRGGRDDPYNVSRYRGGVAGVVDDEVLLAAGYSRSEIGILKANALKESGGKFGAVNTWDNQIVSWGMAQFAGHAGTLAKLLSYLKEDPRSREAYARWFAGQGIDVAHGRYAYFKDGAVQQRKGWHVVVTGDDGEAHAGDHGWAYLRTQPRLVGALMLAGNDVGIACGQCLFWRDVFLKPAINRVIGKTDDHSGAPASDFVTSEYGLALLVRLGNWMPAYVRRWSNEFIAELAAEHPEFAVRDPATWEAHPALEEAFREKIKDRRRSVKKGSYDTYALDLDRARGSFVAGRDS